MLENTFTSISDMADVIFPFLKSIKPIKKLMLKIKWESDLAVAKVKLPILFISGDMDTFVPTWMT